MRLVCILLHRRHRQPPEPLASHGVGDGTGGGMAVWCDRCQRTWRRFILNPDIRVG